MPTRAEKVLAALAAHDAAYANARTVRSARAMLARAGIEPLAIDNGISDDFGTILGQQSVAELQDLVNLWAYRMAQLTQTYANFAPSWVAQDPTAFIAWTNDWNGLQQRYAAANGAAKDFIAASKLSPVPASMIAAQTQYDMLSKAMRQCYPPDGCPTQQGDWADLFARITAAANALGGTPPVDNPPQPTASDADQSASNALQPIDIIGQNQPQKSKPTSSFGWALIAGSAGLAGGLGFALAGPYGGLAGMAFGAFVGDAIKNQISAITPSWL